MPTIPPRKPSPIAAAESQRSRWAQSFGSDAQRYDQNRPGYPLELVDHILGASPGGDVLDVGMGTGISARLFVAAGCTVLGVEPDPRMAAIAAEHGFTVEVATFEQWQPAGRVFDVVIAGQAWHWVDPVAGATKAAQVLRPGGRLALFWNAFQLPAELAQACAGVYQTVLPDTPFAWAMSAGVAAYSGQVAKAIDGIGHVGAFGEPEQWEFTRQQRLSRQEWLAQVPTFGGHDQIPTSRAQ